MTPFASVNILSREGGGGVEGGREDLLEMIKKINSIQGLLFFDTGQWKTEKYQIYITGYLLPMVFA